MRAKVAEAEAERPIAQRRNELRRVAAELEAEAKSIEERAEAGALAAQATAMQALEAVRRELEAVRLQSDVVIPAEIKQEAVGAGGGRRGGQHRRERPGHGRVAVAGVARPG